MWANEDIFRKSIDAAKDHMRRAEEGRGLLKEGMSIGELGPPTVGLTAEETKKRRETYFEFIRSMDTERLRRHLDLVNLQLNARYEHEDRGTSELEWQRNAITQILQDERGISA